MTDEFVTRRALRHVITRRRNERIAELRDEAWPLYLVMHPDTRSEILIDDDPDEQRTIDFEGKAFMSIPIITDPSVELGLFELQWPEAPDGA